MKNLISILLLTTISVTLQAQTTIEGQVIDEKTKQAIPFAAIVPNDYAQYGTVSDIDGNYKLTIPEKVEIIHVKHISYLQKEILKTDLLKDPNIKLSSSVFEINEVLINAKENPAYRIIRKVAKNKKLHNPDKYKYYTCEIYQKTTSGPIMNDTVTIDSTNQRLKDLSDSVFIYMMETHSQKYHQSSKGEKEIVKAIRVAGFKQPEFFISNNEIQPFHFYDEYINLYGNLFINPISNQAIGKYYYEIIDTVIQAPDTIFSIFYRPYKNKIFDGLQGQLQINTNGYAIKNVFAKPAGHHLLNINVHQQYQYVNGKWFPEEINYDIVIESPQFAGLILQMSGRSKMMNPIFTEEEKQSIRIDNIAYEFAPKAFKRDTNYWGKLRSVELTFKEKNSYITIDSVSEKEKIELKFKWGFSFAQSQKLPLKYVSLDYNNMFNFNPHEGIQLGFGLYTNDDIAKWFSIGGYYRYGFKDKMPKYGADIKFEISRAKRFEFGGGYTNDLNEPGYNNFDQMGAKIFSRSLLMELADSVNNNFAFAQRQFGKWFIRLDGKQQSITPLYDYKFAPDSTITTFANNQVGISVRFAPNERVNFVYGFPFVTSNYPIFKLTYIHGSKGANGNGFDYNKVLFSAIHQFKITGFGESKVHLKAGYIHSDVPLFALMEGEGSYNSSIPFIFNSYFQVIKPGEFFNNRFVGLFYTHNFGPILRISEKIRPALVIAQNMGYGELYHPEHHMYVNLKSMEKGYFETGVILNNLYLKNMYNAAYIGLGFGAFYKYGAYASTKEINNFAFKISLAFNW